MVASLVLVTFSPARAQQGGSSLLSAGLILRGPYESAVSIYDLPANWQPSGQSTLHLELNVAAPAPGAVLTLFLNNHLLGNLPLDQPGLQTIGYSTKTADSHNEIRWVLDEGANCGTEHALVIIQPQTSLTVGHLAGLPATDLTLFPRPIISSAPQPDPITLVVPDSPSPLELQAVMTVAAALGRFRHGDLSLDLVTASRLTAEQRNSSHLLLIGTVNQHPLIDILILPMPPINGDLLLPDRYEFEHAAQLDGVVEQVNSPFNPARMILIVSGSTDTGVLKAAQALSTGILRPNILPNAAVIKDVNLPASQVLQTDFRFDNLGYGAQVLETRGEHLAAYHFIAPAAASGTLNLTLSAALAPGDSSSSLLLSLNGFPLESVTAPNTSGVFQRTVRIPGSALRPGENTLSVELTPISCASSAWTIWPESQVQLDPAGNQATGLQDFPRAFLSDPSMSDVAFVLQPNEPATWRAAARLAAALGAQSTAGGLAPQVFFANHLTETDRNGLHLILVGRASQLPLIAQLGNALPAPFAPYSDTPRTEQLPVTFRVTYSDPVGYLEWISSPWNPQKTILLVAGNTFTGLDWAADALIHPSRQLQGNLVILQDGRVLSPPVEIVPGAPADVPPWAWFFPIALLVAGLLWFVFRRPKP